MAVSTFAGGIDRGTADLCLLTDGTIVVASSKGS